MPHPYHGRKLMQKLKLTKKWNDHRKGETVVVDDKRGAWLKKNGFLDEPKRLVEKTVI